MCEKPQSKSVWHDQLNDCYKLLDNYTGESQQVYKTGNLLKQFNSQLTGQVSFKERIQKAGHNRQYYPFEAKSVELKKNEIFYNPQQDKFVGYQQFNSPVCEPYFNDRYNVKNFKKNKKQQEMIKQVRNNYEPVSQKNMNLYKHKSNKDVVPVHITGSIKDMKQVEKNNKVEVMKQRQHQSFVSVSKQLQQTVKIIN